MTTPDDTQPALLDYMTRRYEQMKLRLTRMLRNADLAGDALQDTWLRLHGQQGQARSIQSPGAYLMRMAANAAVDIQRRHGQSLPHEDVDALLDLADTAPGPAHVTQSRSELNTLVALLNRLPKRQRQVIILVRWEDMPQKDVAKVLGVSLRTVEKDLKLAHDYLDARMRNAER